MSGRNTSRPTSTTVRSSSGVLSEKNLHWLPILYRISDKVALGNYSYQGSAYDMEMDDRLAERGYYKVSHGKSFILHKGWLPWHPDGLSTLTPEKA